MNQMDVKTNTLFGLCCEKCGETFMPPKYICSKCSSANLKRFDLSGKGEILTYTTIRVPPAQFQGQEPYDVAIVKLAEGLRITARLKVEEGKKAELGAHVSFAGNDEHGVRWFKVC